MIQGAYPDATSYCLINEASVTDLNTRLEKPVNPEQFRPNFVIKGASAYEEDTWGWVKIGDVIFKTVMPCTRCIFTTVDPETGIKNPKAEPLKTLKRFTDLSMIALFSSVMKFLTLLQVLYLRRLQSQRFDHSYRQIMDPIIRPLVGESPVLGIHLGLRNSDGIVRVGDPVYVGLPEEQPLLISPP